MDQRINPHGVQVGSQVRFLNAVGGGRVTRIAADTAWVEDEDGFEIPTLLRECVVVEAGDTFIPEIRPPKVIQDKLKQGKKSQSSPSAPAPSAPEIVKQVRPRELSHRSPSDAFTIELAFVPKDRTKLGRSDYAIYLVNNTGYSLFYAWQSAVGTNYKLRECGEAAPSSVVLLESISPNQVNELEGIALQLLPFAEATLAPLREPLSVRMRFDGTKLFKLHSFRENEYFDSEAYLIPIVRDGAQPEEVMVDADALSEALQTRAEAKESKPRESIQPSPAKRSGEPLVIDLHADALLETTRGMSPAAILEYQVDYFHRTMQENRQHKGQRIIFIHGKGDGVLRAAVIKALKLKWPSCRWQDASFREYGYGATQVTIG